MNGYPARSRGAAAYRPSTPRTAPILADGYAPAPPCTWSFFSGLNANGFLGVLEEAPAISAQPSAAGPRDWGLYLVTDRRQTGGRDLVEVLSQALGAGVRAIQLREKDLDTVDVFRLGERLLPMTRRAGASLIINDRADVAMALGADGVHLTRKSLPPKDARALVGAGMCVGISCHTIADVQEAVDGGVDFVTLGPIFATPSKAAYGPPIGLGVLEQARTICPLPIFAIGGISAGRVRDVLKAGADGVAAISAVLAAPDPAAAVRDLLAATGR